MRKTLFKAAIVGGIIAFLWSIFSWTAIDWPSMVFKTFCDERKVAQVIQDNTTSSGMYLLPNPYGETEGDSSFRSELYKNGPIVFASVQKDGIKDMKSSLVLSFISEILAAFIIAWGLSKTKGLSYLQKVGFVTLYGGVMISILGILPGFLWKGFPFLYTLLSIFDIVLGWVLAGLAMAKIVARKE